jgi:hypothetical protein
VGGILEAKMRDYYLLIDNQQVGPYTADQLHQMLAQGRLTAESSAWYDGLPDWAPVSSILEPASVRPTPVAPAPVLAAAAPAPVVAHQAIPVSGGVVQTNVKQGALIGSLVCLVLGLLLMYFTLFSFILYGPLFLVAFILSIVAMAQGRVAGGILLLLATLVIPTIMGLVLFTHRAGTALEAYNTTHSIPPTTSADSSAPADTSAPAAVATASTSAATPPDSSTAPPAPATAATPTTSSPTPATVAPASVPSTPAPTDTNTASAAAAPAPATSPHPALDTKDGFRTYKLGTPLSQFNADDMDAGTSFSSTDSKPYFVKNFDKQLGAAEIDSIRLDFQQDMLQEIAVSVKGEQSVAALKADLIAAYGQPDENNDMITQSYSWNGNDCVLDMRIDLGGAGATADFTSKSVDAKIKDVTDQKAKAGAASGAQGL